MGGGRLAVLVAVTVVALTASTAASAHQTAVNNGVTVTMHVTPNDEPLVGLVSQVLITRVAVRKKTATTFGWTTCRCTLRVTDSDANVVFQGVVQPRTDVTFPAAAAYKLEFSGRVKRKGLWRTFKVAFAIRAYDQVSG